MAAPSSLRRLSARKLYANAESCAAGHLHQCVERKQLQLASHQIGNPGLSDAEHCRRTALREGSALDLLHQDMRDFRPSLEASGVFGFLDGIQIDAKRFRLLIRGPSSAQRISHRPTRGRAGKSCGLGAKIRRTRLASKTPYKNLYVISTPVDHIPFR